MRRYIFINNIPPLFQAVKDAGIDVNGFLTVGVSAALRQLLEFGLFHGDPHPGNIFAMQDGRIAYVDFGNVAVLSQVKYGLQWYLIGKLEIFNVFFL